MLVAALARVVDDAADVALAGEPVLQQVLTQSRLLELTVSTSRAP